MKRWFPIFFILALFATAAFLPFSFWEGLPLCFIKMVSGWDCPGCGLTRAFSLLFHGQWRQAVAMNALAPVLVLWLLIYVADHCYFLARGNRPAWFTTQGNRWIARLFLFLFLGQWVWKNGLPFFTMGS